MEDFFIKTLNKWLHSDDYTVLSVGNPDGMYRVGLLDNENNRIDIRIDPDQVVTYRQDDDGAPIREVWDLHTAQMQLELFG
jgi:hypothetical protein